MRLIKKLIEPKTRENKKKKEQRATQIKEIENEKRAKDQINKTKSKTIK